MQMFSVWFIPLGLCSESTSSSQDYLLLALLWYLRLLLATWNSCWSDIDGIIVLNPWLWSPEIGRWDYGREGISLLFLTILISLLSVSIYLTLFFLAPLSVFFLLCLNHCPLTLNFTSSFPLLFLLSPHVSLSVSVSLSHSFPIS
jgi:pilus assembly protein TadC